jgi:transcriptional regulator with XRE-family HTH domain
MNDSIGKMIKDLRTDKNFTLKDMSEKTGLSTGFLSQLERGITSVAIDSLEKIASILEVDLLYFFQAQKTVETKKNNIVRKHQRIFIPVTDTIYQTTLSNHPNEFEIFPRIFELLPTHNELEQELALYTHKGEEFVYVLEGILTIILDNQEHILYPGDSIQIKSDVPHNWKNETNKITKILCINSPNPFKD